MMIIYKTGNIFNEKVDALVNTVNCVGVMGRGIALQFKKIFPENYHAYVNACQKNLVSPGKMFTFKTQSVNPRFIINFPTKRHWRAKSLLQDIIDGLQSLAHEIKFNNIRSIAIPPLGSGLGGLNWLEVRNWITLSLQNLEDIEIIVFEPSDAIPKLNTHPINSPPTMTSGRAVLITLIQKYLNGLMDPIITLLEVHKLMYFMQEAGEPLQLRFNKAHYGPYAENLRHVLNVMEGYYITGYHDGGDQPNKKLNLVFGALKKAQTYLEKNNHLATQSRLQKVLALVEGFETPTGLELLSTVHWIARNEHKTSLNDIIKAVYSWNPKKQQFTPRQIEIALTVLNQQSWI
ncbi:MAG: macro domain-containing protein [Legionellales bacterium]|nr:macro domain-containing protein [Legionellales bacterium]